MSKSPRVIRLLMATLAVIGLIATATPAVNALPASECIEYGEVIDAPAGKIPRDDLVLVHDDPLSSWIGEHPTQAARAAAGRTVTVPVAFHVVRKDMSVAGGNVPSAWIASQISVLNDSFSGATGGADTGFRFRLASVDRTTKSSWFNTFNTSGGFPRFFRGSSKEIKMKQALHTGGPETLNVYSSELGKFLLGWAYFPSSFETDGLPRFYDGVVIDHRTLPGADFAPYDEGDTLTHEIGHWLQVFHTFQGGCIDPGDMIGDTAFEASPAFGCPTGRDTCTQPGQDPITNFMDYTDDACMFEFTAQQGDRMQQAWATYRA